ncbi:MAG: hypothetical protein J6U13_04180 [Salinivirgaceae bacterium]|nr:hypothetical protein [Salinivirgaceae bacterium]
MSWILYFIYLLLLIWVIQKAPFFNAPHIERRWIIFAFLTKVLGGVALFFIYSYYYDPKDSDIFHYFNDGLIIHSALFENPLDFLRMVSGINSDAPDLMHYYMTCDYWLKPFYFGLPNDNLIVIRTHALLCLVSMGNFHIHNLFFSFFGFIGLWALYKAFCKDLANMHLLLFLCMFGFPSVWIWTSGALKESLMMAIFGLLIYFFRDFLKKPSVWNVAAMLVLSYMMKTSKYYVLMAAMPAMLAAVWIKYRPKLAVLKFAATHLLLFGLFYCSKFITGFDMIEAICGKQQCFISMSEDLGNVGSYIYLPPLDNGLQSMIVNAPNALFNSLFRPTIFEAKSAMMLFAAIENIFIICMLAAGLLFIQPKNFSNRDVWCCLSYITIFFVLIGLTTPVLGALVRYKVPALPFLGIFILLIVNDEKAQSANKWIEKKIKRKR